ncbi:hypothetical protein SAMN04515620_15014 [Collimonas sp. OK607]|nr:hypothetical protein SAMN04515620_15014 [Collimonas sp. OK607]
MPTSKGTNLLIWTRCRCPKNLRFVEALSYMYAKRKMGLASDILRFGTHKDKSATATPRSDASYRKTTI